MSRQAYDKINKELIPIAGLDVIDSVPVQNSNHAVSSGGVYSAFQNIEASKVLYDNTDSGLTADNMQEAIDEIHTEVDGVTSRTNVSSNVTNKDTNVSTVNCYLTSVGKNLYDIQAVITVTDTISAGTVLCTIPTEYKIETNELPFIAGRGTTQYKMYASRNASDENLTDIHAGEAINAGSVRMDLVCLHSLS